MNCNPESFDFKEGYRVGWTEGRYDRDKQVKEAIEEWHGGCLCHSGTLCDMCEILKKLGHDKE